MPTLHQEWYIIVNPHAGSGKTMCQWIPAENHLKELGVPFYTVYTTHKHHATELAATACRLGYRKIMAVGGDGSIHEVFNGVISWCEQYGVPTEDFYLAVAPIGSGNDWIKAFNVPNDTFKVTELMKKESFGRQDVVKVVSDGGKVSYMANIGGVGFDSHVCERVNRLKDRGFRSKRIYINALIHTLIHMNHVNLGVYADGEEVYSGPCYSIALGNGPYSGSGMRQCCLAKPADGILDAMVVPVISIFKLLKEVPRIFNGTVDKSSYIHYIQCKHLQIIPSDASSQDIFELDGEIEGKLPLDLQMTGRQINVLIGR